MTQYPDQAKQKAEFDRLMTAATVFRRRGDYGQATQTIKQALQIFPDDIDGREFAADMIYAHGDVDKAAEHYKSILEAEPGRASAEEKYAKAILEIAEAERQKELLKLMVENPGKFKPLQPKNGSAAAALSVAPGLGHIYCGEYVKGAVLFVGWVIVLLLFFATLNPSMSDDLAQKLMEKISAPAAAFACVAASIHIYAILSAASTADRTKDGKPKDPSEPQ